ncbi:MAG: AraC family transcriptional regulator ligand-binding domain-containing protein [Actinomycetota bacterium]
MAAPSGVRPATSLRLLCETALESGIAVDIALDGTGLTPSILGEPGAEITVEQEMLAIANVAARYRQPAGLGVAVGRRMHVNSFGIWGFAMLTSPTYRAATETGLAHFRLSLMLADVQLHEGDDEAWLRIDLSDLDPAVRAYVLERHVVVALNFSREAIDDATMRSFRIETHLSTAYAADLRRHIGLDVVGGAARDALVFPAAVLDRVIPRSDPATLRYCLEQCELLSARLENEPDPWSERVRDLLVADISHEHTIGAVAADLAVNERTLRRRLDEEGTSFRELYAETRLAIARELLETAGLSVETVARRVGYAEPASFVRSFARHYGETPGQVRRTLAS